MSHQHRFNKLISLSSMGKEYGCLCGNTKTRWNIKIPGTLKETFAGVQDIPRHQVTKRDRAVKYLQRER